MTLESYINTKPLVDNLNYIMRQEYADIFIAIQNSNYSFNDFMNLTCKLGEHTKLSKSIKDKTVWTIKDVKEKLHLTDNEIEMIEYLAESLEG
ncbi:MAG: hypothetical protein AAGF07_03690 [Patescibacteria group bacterium]